MLLERRASAAICFMRALGTHTQERDTVQCCMAEWCNHLCKAGLQASSAFVALCTSSSRISRGRGKKDQHWFVQDQGEQKLGSLHMQNALWCAVRLGAGGKVWRALLDVSPFILGRLSIRAR